MAKTKDRLKGRPTYLALRKVIRRKVAEYMGRSVDELAWIGGVLHVRDRGTWVVVTDYGNLKKIPKIPKPGREAIGLKAMKQPEAKYQRSQRTPPPPQQPPKQSFHDYGGGDGYSYRRGDY